MANIYANARQVLVYLGRPFDGHAETMQAITDAIAQLKAKYSDTAALRLALELNTELPDVRLPVALTEERLIAFYSSRWFTRLWALQEVALSRNAIAFYGHESIILMDAILLAQWIGKRDYQRGSFRNRKLGLLARSIDYARALYRMRCFYEYPSSHALGDCRPGVSCPGLPLHDMLRETHDHLNSEPRDKVYAILGLCGADVGEKIKPDYSLPLPTVYTQAARLACLVDGDEDSLDITRLARVLGNKPTQWYKEHNWPTWVPLWQEVYDPLVNPCGFPWWMFNAAGDTTAELTPAPLGDPVLRCEGVVVDEVEYVSRPFVPLSEHETTDDLRLDFENAVRELSPLAAKALTPNGQSYTTALGLTLACGYYPFMQSEYSLGETHFGAALQNTSLRSLVALLSQSARDNLDEGLGDEARYLLQFQIHTRFRSVFFTKRGYMGLGSQHMMVDDVVCVPFGSDAPWMLRREGGHYVFLGPCYVHGIMGGEFMRAASGDLVRSFEIH
ncbi:hypothetical protein M409DRAFT_21668 [Zasmidium cellare ATCC 36951]|uniref:Uncharacterized protein n=1 Tax=Zasmidium cellare ATCC 36951 TaxID=1080233 RepID=A0A6A6CPS4_ZASCE|nr:uncharacterized protein M409DRAFT_21668 [Zasmidium cellare ATCC 36951]KAF2168228.1 hypothetical protein M409DRAFT_21668 [Zasmidium cellare ATCC 36951]